MKLSRLGGAAQTTGKPLPYGMDEFLLLLCYRNAGTLLPVTLGNLVWPYADSQPACGLPAD